MVSNNDGEMFQSFDKILLFQNITNCLRTRISKRNFNESLGGISANKKSHHSLAMKILENLSHQQLHHQNSSSGMSW